MDDVSVYLAKKYGKSMRRSVDDISDFEYERIERQQSGLYQLIKLDDELAECHGKRDILNSLKVRNLDAMDKFSKYFNLKMDVAEIKFNTSPSPPNPFHSNSSSFTRQKFYPSGPFLKLKETPDSMYQSSL